MVIGIVYFLLVKIDFVAVFVDVFKKGYNYMANCYVIDM